MIFHCIRIVLFCFIIFDSCALYRKKPKMTSPAIQAADKAQKASREPSEVNIQILNIFRYIYSQKNTSFRLLTLLSINQLNIPVIGWRLVPSSKSKECDISIRSLYMAPHISICWLFNAPRMLDIYGFLSLITGYYISKYE